MTVPVQQKGDGSWVRRLTHEGALLALFTLYLAGCILLLLFLRRMSEETIIAAVRDEMAAVAEIMLPRGRSAGPVNSLEISARWLKPSMSDGPFELAAGKLMESPTGTRIERLQLEGPGSGFRVAIANGHGDVLMLATPIDSRLRIISRNFERIYVIGSLMGLILLASIAALALRRRGPAAAAVSTAARARTRQAPMLSDDRATLVWILGLAAVIFAFELRAPPEAGIGVAYVSVVIVGLRLRYGLSTYLTATLCTMLTVTALLLAPWDADMWPVLINRTLAVFAIWSVAVLGLWQKRSLRAQHAAALETGQVREMNLALQESLQRTEDAERELRRGRRLLDAVARMARIGGWEYDIATQTPHWSEEVYNIHGMSSDEQPDLTRALDFFRPEVRATITAAMERVIADGTPYDITVPFTDANGRALWVRMIGMAEQSNGVTTRLSGAMQDVTAQHEAQLRQARGAKLSAEGLWEYDFSTTLAWCSEMYSVVLGHPAEEKILSLEELLHAHPDDAANVRAAFEYHIATGAPFHVNLRKGTASGKWRWYRIRGAVERDDAGAPLRFCGTLNDIHQEKLIHEELKLTRMRLDRAISGSSDGLYEIDLTGKSSEWYSPRVYEMLGYSTDDPFPKTLLDLVHPDDRVRLDATMLKCIREHEPLDLIYRLRCRDGDWRWIRIRGRSERDGGGTAVRFSGSLQDITEQYQAEEALKTATQEAGAANRAKSDFLANMSHEIRTPMNGVLGMTELLLDTRLDETQREFADAIRASATALLTIINDLLDFSKIEAGKLELEHISMDLRSCIEDVGLLMAVQANAKKLELIVNVQPTVPDYVMGDPHRLAQVLINLIGNAVKFTVSGEVAVEVSSLAVQAGKHLLHFEVRDSGMGMRPDIVAKLFQPFTQADVSTTRHHGGTGLGLSIVRRLVGMMGGSVGVESNPGQGSTFSFTLAFDPAEDSAIPQAPVPRTAQGERVLMVDDSDTNRRVVRTQLESAGFRTAAAADAPATLTQIDAAVAAGQSFDVAIIDEQIPSVDSLELGRQIRARPGTENLKLVMLTSLDSHGRSRELSHAGFSGYLTKPVRRDELLACVMRVLQGAQTSETQRQQIVLARSSSLASLAARQRFAGHVLIVEDNPVNQQVAKRFLERLGCDVTIAGDGAAGVAAFFHQQFDLVLMDVQMPVMDGLEATRAIRQRESGSRTPIVALTASAMTDEVERCMQAGMDVLLSKPIELPRLRDVLTRFGLQQATTAGVRPDEESARRARAESVSERSEAGQHKSGNGAAVHIQTLPPPVDLTELKALADGDVGFVRELCQTFGNSAATIATEMRMALASGDRARLATLSHKLKGGSASICARPLSTLCATLEREAQTMAPESLEHAVAGVIAAAGAVNPYIERHLQ